MPGPLHLAFLGCGFITRVHSRQLRAFGGPYDMVRDHVLCMRSVAVGESIVIPVHQAAGLTRSLDVVAFVSSGVTVNAQSTRFVTLLPFESRMQP